MNSKASNVYIILSISLFIGLPSCEKPTTNEYCIKRILKNPSSIVLSETDLNFTKSLFDANHLSFSRYLFYNLQNDELGKHHVRCWQYINSLVVFSNELIFHFDSDGHYYYLSGKIIDEITLGVKPSMSANSVVDIFISELSNDRFVYNNLNEIKSICYDCELGYYDLNVGTSYTESKFTRAWKVKLSENDYPYAIINDLTASVIYYDNGIRDKCPTSRFHPVLLSVPL